MQADGSDSIGHILKWVVVDEPTKGPCPTSISCLVRPAGRLTTALPVKFGEHNQVCVEHRTPDLCRPRSSV